MVVATGANTELGAIAERAGFAVGPQHLLQRFGVGERGGVTRNLATTHLLDRLAALTLDVEPHAPRDEETHGPTPLGTLTLLDEEGIPTSTEIAIPDAAKARHAVVVGRGSLCR